MTGRVDAIVVSPLRSTRRACCQHLRIRRSRQHPRFPLQEIGDALPHPVDPAAFLARADPTLRSGLLWRAGGRLRRCFPTRRGFRAQRRRWNASPEQRPSTFATAEADHGSFMRDGGRTRSVVGHVHGVLRGSTGRHFRSTDRGFWLPHVPTGDGRQTRTVRLMAWRPAQVPVAGPRPTPGTPARAPHWGSHARSRGAAR